jgi:hypothetical protein
MIVAITARRRLRAARDNRWRQPHTPQPAPEKAAVSAALERMGLMRSFLE